MLHCKGTALKRQYQISQEKVVSKGRVCEMGRPDPKSPPSASLNLSASGVRWRSAGVANLTPAEW